MVFHFSFSIQELLSFLLSQNIFVCKHFNNILLLEGVIDQIPNLFDIWQDSKTNSTMFHKDLDHQGMVGSHLLNFTCGNWNTLKTPCPHLTWLYKKVLNMAFIKNEQILEYWMWLSQKERALLNPRVKLN